MQASRVKLSTRQTILRNTINVVPSTNGTNFQIALLQGSLPGHDCRLTVVRRTVYAQDPCIIRCASFNHQPCELLNVVPSLNVTIFLH